MIESRDDPIIDPAGQAQRERVRRGIAQFQVQLQAAGIDFREPPPEPTSCCGRGCNGCVWESYEAALTFWYEDGGTLLASH
ncbi:MAG: oxidoreductase-like domain-containing protein [Limnohabitans sp.]